MSNTNSHLLPHASWRTGHRLLLASALALLLSGLFVVVHVPLVNAQTNCLSVTPHILPARNTIPTDEQLWITVGNGCPTEALSGSLHVTDSFLYCNGTVFVGLDRTMSFPTLVVDQTVTAFQIGEYQTGCPPGSPPNGPLEEVLHGDANATGPDGQSYTGSGTTTYTFS